MATSTPLLRPAHLALRHPGGVFQRTAAKHLVLQNERPAVRF